MIVTNGLKVFLNLGTNNTNGMIGFGVQSTSYQCGNMQRNIIVGMIRAITIHVGICMRCFLVCRFVDAERNMGENPSLVASVLRPTIIAPHFSRKPVNPEAQELSFQLGGILSLNDDVRN
jgi:hypothetical protein